MSTVTIRQNRLPKSLLAPAVIPTAFRYLLVGGVAFSFDVALLALFHDIIGWPLEPSTATAFVISFFATFALQRTLTFRTTANPLISLIKYGSLVGFNTVAVTTIVSFIASTGAPWLVGKIIAVTVTTTWNFFAYRYWIFSRRSAGAAPAADD